MDKPVREGQSVKASEIGSMEDVFGKDDSMFQDAKKVALEVDRPVDFTKTQEVSGGEEVAPPRKRDIPAEYVITHMKNLETGHVFEVNDQIRQQKHLRPCTAEGKVLVDNRRFSDLR